MNHFGVGLFGILGLLALTFPVLYFCDAKWPLDALDWAVGLVTLFPPLLCLWMVILESGLLDRAGV